MKLFILSLITLFFTSPIFSQDKIISLKLEKGRVIADSYFAKNGNQYIFTSTKSKFAKKQKNKLFCYDKNLQEKYSLYVDGGNLKGAPYVRKTGINRKFTNNGDYFLNGTQLIDKTGKIQIYSYKNSKVNTVYRFFNDIGITKIGSLKGRKYRKRKYSEGDIFVYTVKHSDKKEILETLKIPAINTTEKYVSWGLGQIFSDRFLMFTKNNLNKEKTIDTYHFATFDYRGNLLSYVPVTIKLNSENHIIPSSENKPVDIATSRSSSHSHFFYDIKENTYYIYGAYSNKITKDNVIKAKVKGFFLHKFDKDGKLLWEYNYSFEHPENLFTGEFLIEFNKFIDDKGVLRIDFGLRKNRDENGGYFVINTKTGKLINSNNPFKNFKHLRSVSTFNTEIITMLPNKFEYKLNTGVKINYDVFLATILKPEIMEYIKSKKEEFFFNVSITEDSVILKELDVKGRVYKMMLYEL